MGSAGSRPIFSFPDRGDRNRRREHDCRERLSVPRFKKLTRVKQMPYESGMDPATDARQRFDVRFYLVAIVFLLFDVELLFLYPWAVAQWSAAAAPDSVTAEAHGQGDRGNLLAAPEAPARPRVVAAGIPAEFRGLVFLGDHGLHRDPLGGLRLRMAERGLQPWLKTPFRHA